ncbi:MAG: cytochrome ubiquinol oxidase subunit I [Deltaproteobacteria bacterium]|nr:cytochrome ubiquinol oxidase subunit I [Deltaproteobacteria bacterium]MCL5276852.1 cytochrome ubiquinol oxidase subunit I [Deltaproteobacteria bacterium]
MYPVWQVPVMGSALVIAFIASFHILPSHLATSAFWFNVYVEDKAYKEDRPELLEFIKKYVLVILIFSFIFGSLSGVGIWYAVTVSNPKGISALIHNYVWGWASEWVFFIIEILAIYIYYYTLGRVDDRTHLTIGLIYAIGSWISMVIITGIISFMLSPGKWLRTGGFFDGFFNPTYLPQLLMRTSFMFAIAGLYAIVVAGTLKNREVASFIVRRASVWGMAGAVLAALFFKLYLWSLPDTAKELYGMSVLVGTVPDIAVAAFIALFVWFIVVWIRPQLARLVPGVLAILILLAGIFSAESVRERIRKPYVIDHYMYSNQIIPNDMVAKGVQGEMGTIDREGILHYSYFVPEGLRTIDDADLLRSGRIIAQIECSACHTLESNGWLRPLPAMMEKAGLVTVDDTQAFIGFLDSFPFMPQFAGTAAEKRALAAYLVSIRPHPAGAPAGRATIGKIHR